VPYAVATIEIKVKVLGHFVPSSPSFFFLFNAMGFPFVQKKKGKGKVI